MQNSVVNINYDARRYYHAEPLVWVQVPVKIAYAQ